MAGTFNDQTSLRAALYILLANDGELFNRLMEAEVLASEWLGTAWTPAYVSATSFSLPVDLVEAYAPGRAVRLHLASGHVVAYVASAIYDPETGLTTVGLDRECLDNSLDEARLGVLSPGGAAPADLATRAWAEAQPRALGGLLPDPVSAESARTDPDLGAVRFANGGAVAWGHFEPWLDGMAWRVRLVCMMSSAEAAALGLKLFYQVFGPDEAANPVKRRWQASIAQALGADRAPTTPNGFRYRVSLAGTSGAAEPTWPTTIGATVADGSVTWQCLGPGLKLATPVAITPPNAAYVQFTVDLDIPAGVAALGERVHFGLARAKDDAHAGDLLVNELWLCPVEV